MIAFFLTFKDDSKPKADLVTVGGTKWRTCNGSNSKLGYIKRENDTKIDIYDIFRKKVDGYKKVDALSQILYSLPKLPMPRCKNYIAE
jgi:hypothetical protein